MGQSGEEQKQRDLGIRLGEITVLPLLTMTLQVFTSQVSVLSHLYQE